MKLIPFDHDELSQYQFDDIDQLCRYLVKKRISLTITEFIKFTHQEFYSYMDISFLDYSLKICLRKNEFCIDPIKEFVKLRVKDNEIRPSNLKVTLDKSQLIEGKDYQLLHVQQQSETSRGVKYKDIYLLNPDSFKVLLLDIYDHEKRIKFVKYFILFEKCVAYYDHNYQSVLVKKTIKHLEESNSTLQEDIKLIQNQNEKLINEVHEVKQQNNEIIKYNKSADKKLDKITVELAEIKMKLNDLSSKYYNKTFEYNSQNILDSKCIKIFEIINPDENEYTFYTIMYCSINSLYKQIRSKLENNALNDNDEIDFSRFRLIEIYKPMNDSMFVIQNLTNTLKNYCDDANTRYEADESVYNGSSRTIKIVNNRRRRVLKLIKTQFDNQFVENLNEVDQNEQEHNILNEYFQNVYLTEVQKVITNILNDRMLNKNYLLLGEVRNNLLSIK
jgi:hypothetical protein